MAIIHFTNYKRSQSRGMMGSVMRYTMQEKKIMFNGHPLISGINCRPESAYHDFLNTKLLYHKTDGILFYHMVQSFPKGEQVDPAAAHAAAVKLAEYFDGHEVLVCTHIDRDHIHSHFLVNSVSFETGKKLHLAREQLEELRKCNDQVCASFSLPVFNPAANGKGKNMSAAEYRVAARGKSNKLMLMNIINDCMRFASNREEFIYLIESEGCRVRWEETRKNLTYTIPSGWQCRDRLLFGDKYLKENMEHEFKIRTELINGRAYGAEPTETSISERTTDRNTPHRERVAATDGSTGYAECSTDKADFFSVRNIRSTEDDSSADAAGFDQGGSVCAESDGTTGWEREREAFLAFKTHITPPTSISGMADNSDMSVGVAGGIVQLLQAVGTSGYDTPIRDSTTMRSPRGRKQSAKERQKRIALGQKEDDYESDTSFQQNM